MAWRKNVTLSVALSLVLGLSGCSIGSVPKIEPVPSAIQLGADTTSSPNASGSPTGIPSAGSPSTSSSSTPNSSKTPETSPSPSGYKESDSEDSDSTASSAVFDKQAELEIEDQSGNGKTVKIHEMSIGIDNLWLVILTSSGTRLATVLTTTQSKPVTVTLQRPITNSQELLARLYMDDGDGLFEPSQDSPVYEEPGELIDEDFEYVVG